MQGVNRDLPIGCGAMAPSGLGTPVTLSWVGLNQSAQTVATLTPTIMVSGNTTAAFNPAHTYSFTPTVTSGVVRFYAAPLPGMSTNSGIGAFLTNIQVTAPNPPQQTVGECLFAVSNNQLNLMRIKGGQNITASSDNYGVLTLDTNPNLPIQYDGTYPNRIWSDNGTLKVGDV